jgi:hypothetical protein
MVRETGAKGGRGVDIFGARLESMKHSGIFASALANAGIKQNESARAYSAARVSIIQTCIRESRREDTAVFHGLKTIG